MISIYMETKLKFEEKIYFSLFSIVTLTFIFFLIDRFSSVKTSNYNMDEKDDETLKYQQNEKEGMKDIGEQIRDAFERPIKKSIEATKRNIERSNDAIRNGFERGFNKVKEDAERNFNKVKEDTERGFNKIKNDTERGFNKLKDDTERGLNVVKDQLEGGFNEVKNGLENTFNKVTDVFQKAFDKVFEFFNKIKEVFVYLGSVFEWVFDHVKCGINWITNFRFCFLWYMLEVIGKILYLPITFSVWIIKNSFGIDLQPFVNKFWEYLGDFDCAFFSISGFHLIHYSKDVMDKCYNCQIREFPKFNVRF